MQSLVRLLALISFLTISILSQANKLPPCDTNFIPFCDKQRCCNDMGGISYCDSSAGRYVCNNGYYSACYCTRHAVMDLQKISGCCLWQGGVLGTTPTGLVMCNNGGISELCSLQTTTQQISTW
ncbi:MAG: hypothetical protein H0U70_04905 [Tatlockia sp.]|nr:hypothetical protein [Tatlockia sp.]